jgi:WD40 repeat protein/serine/threonine protein kinase
VTDLPASANWPAGASLQAVFEITDMAASDPRRPDNDDSADSFGDRASDDDSGSRTVDSSQIDEPVAADSRTFVSDEFDAPESSDRTIESDVVDDPVAAESRTFVSDEFAPVDKTIASDVIDEPIAADSRTFVSDEFDEPEQSDRTIQSDVVDDPVAAESRTFVSDEFGDGMGGGTDDDYGEHQRTIAVDPEAMRPAELNDRTISGDAEGTSEDSRTIQSDDISMSDVGLMQQSNVRQTINPKSMDSEDRKHWDAVIRGALGTQAVQPKRRPGGSSLVGGGSNLNIQTRTMVEGPIAPGRVIDYRIEKKLGEGGMGAVYLANQTSLNRNVALKVIKPIADKEKDRLRKSGRLDTIRQHREGQFLSEAVVTGDLEHPNIVPIYDVAATSDGTVFYSMKCVIGTPWLKVIRKRPLAENLDILLKVCDAMAFAHSRGVVHRDLKPENVMLGEFGVVLVMDWGLAIATKEFAKHDSVRKATSLGGSPAYMSPELATGPLDKIGPAADIYLIGAMLYEIITGRPPHSGADVSACLRAAATNKIDATDKGGELLEIAHKAMATKPEDRYATTQEFQQAVRGYLAHAESISLEERARGELGKARGTQQYSDYARAMFGFEQAIDLWSGNTKAKEGLGESQLAYAEHALAKQDYELGISLLSQEDENQRPLYARLRKAQDEQESRKARLAWMKRVAAGLLAVIFIGGAAAFTVIWGQKNAIANEKKEADKARDAAVIAKNDAVVARDEAIKSEAAAKEARDAALLAKAAEEKAKEEAIGLKVKAEEAAEAEKEAKLIAVAAQKKAEEAAEAEKIAKLEAVEAQMKAEESALAEMEAKEIAVAAQKTAEEEQKKAVLAAAAEKKAKELAVTAQKKAEDERKKAELAAAAEKKAKELAVIAQQKAEDEQKKAEIAAAAEKKAKEQAVAAQLAAEKAAEAEKLAKEAAIAAQLAEEQAKLAAIAAQEAEAEQRRQAQYEAYVAKIGLAKASIDQNEFDFAREQLLNLKSDPATAPLCGWEWSRLMHQASQATSEVEETAPALDVSMGGSGRNAVALFEGGRVDVLGVDASGTVTTDADRSLSLGREGQSVALSPDGTLIATGEAGGILRLWSMEQGRELRTLDGHSADITQVRFLSNGRLLSASTDKTVRLWDVGSGKLLGTAWHIAPVSAIGFSTGAEPVVAASLADARSGRVVVWRLSESGGKAEFAPVGDFLPHESPVFSVAVSPDGRRIASGDRTGQILLWNAADVTPVDYNAAIDRALSQLSKTPRDVPAEQPLTSFVSLGDNSEVRGEFRLTESTIALAHDDAVRSLAFSQDGSRLISAGDDYTIRVWEAARGTPLETLRGHGLGVRAVAFADGDVVVSAGLDRRIKAWKLSQYAEEVVVDVAAADAGSPDVRAHGEEILSARFNAAGSQVVTTSRDRSAKVWNVRVGDGRMSMESAVLLTDPDSAGPTSLVEGHRYLALSMLASADGRKLWIGGVDGTIRVFDVASGTEQGLLTGTGLNTSFALSRDGRLAVTASSAVGSSIRFWRLGPAGELPTAPEFELAGHSAPATAFAISADGQTVFTGDQRGTGILWDANTGTARGTPLSYHNGLRINSAEFLDDGRLLTASDDQSVAIYNPATAEVSQTLMHDGFVSAMSLSADQRTLLTISESTDPDSGASLSALHLWDVETGNSQVVMRSTQDEEGLQIRSARFAPDGTRFVTIHASASGTDARVRVWTVDAGLRANLQRTLRLPGRIPAADSALLLGRGDYELITLHSNAAYQWSLDSLEHHRSFRSHGDVWDASFSADGKFVVTCSESVKIWDAATGAPLYRLENPHEGSVRSVAFSPVAASLEFCTAGTDGTARTWRWSPDEKSVVPLHTVTGDEAASHPLRAAVYSADGTRLLTVGDQNRLQIWDTAAGTLIASLVPEEGASVNFLCGKFSADGTLVAAGANDKRARLWKVDAESLAAGNAPAAVLAGHADVVSSVAFLPQTEAEAAVLSPRLLTASEDRSARVWDVKTGRELLSLRRHTLGLTAVDVAAYPTAAGNAVVVLTAGLDGRVILWPAGQ